MRPFGGKGLDRIVDLQRPLTVPDQQAEGKGGLLSNIDSRKTHNGESNFLRSQGLPDGVYGVP
jgi:hypothetical protein